MVKTALKEAGAINHLITKNKGSTREGRRGGWRERGITQDLCVFVLEETPPRTPLIKSDSARKRFANPRSEQGAQQKKSKN